MLVYRVFPFDEKAGRGQAGHPLYVLRPQGHGRVDVIGADTWYFGLTPECSVGESFANQRVWTEDMFEMPSVGRRALGVFELPDDLSLLDLDDANALVERALRPTQVIVRNLGVTQGWARRIYDERRADGSRRWAGIRWWSFVHPAWGALALWVDRNAVTPHRFVAAEPLHLEHPAVVAAATTLNRARI